MPESQQCHKTLTTQDREAQQTASTARPVHSKAKDQKFQPMKAPELLPGNTSASVQKEFRQFVCVLSCSLDFLQAREPRCFQCATTSNAAANMLVQHEEGIHVVFLQVATDAGLHVPSLELSC